MTVQDLARQLDLTPFHLAEAERAVTDGYCGDLLSWVMGGAPEGCAWLTIMSNVNVAAVAHLTDVACVILTDNVRPDPALAEKAAAQGINLLGTSLSTYRCTLELGKLL